MKTYYDKNGKKIEPGMLLRMEDGSIEKVYKTTDADGEDGLGINATNEAYFKAHGLAEFEREFYPLHQFDMRKTEIVGWAELPTD